MHRNLSSPTSEDISTPVDKYYGLDDYFMEIDTQTVGTFVDAGQLGDLAILGTSERDACPGSIDMQPYRRTVLLDYLEMSSPCARSERTNTHLQRPVQSPGRWRRTMSFQPWQL